MPQITYVTHDGRRTTIEVEVGISVMEGALRNGVPEIDADCGGNCACGTCQVYVDPAWQAIVGPAADFEEAMLELAGRVEPGARLSCQIEVTGALDGLIVTTPAEQHR